ncbi:MAG: RepB family DNA primase, partial [Holophagaceae bacterium]|nr:RepB family DNA primase [Holophagaceae bacterium]
MKLVQSRLSFYGADKACVDSNRLLRLPGFFHNKAKPRMVLFHDNGDWRYSREEFVEAFAGMSEPKAQATITPPKPVTKPKPDLMPSQDKQKVFKRAVSYLEKCPPAIQGQNGSSTCFETALKIQDGFDLSQDETLQLMWDFYNPRCEPPWTEKELRHKIADASTKCTDRGHLLRDNPLFSEPTKPKRERRTRDAPEAKYKRVNQIVSWLLSGIELFHDGNSGYASTVKGVQKTFKLDTEAFEDWVVSKFYRDFGHILKPT